jgi:hypothetical protein
MAKMAQLLIACVVSTITQIGIFEIRAFGNYVHSSSVVDDHLMKFIFTEAVH